ncbi:FAD-dependent oxidoreductase [candidate division KSB1 bacterium]|nr:FAD-dependent oxidoreductase [candidate division KSB1 bacterium]
MEKSVLIIGGGLSGLLAARRLQEKGFAVIVVDKGRGIGGRMATRRIDSDTHEGVFDYGAQFFTARRPEFVTEVQDWLQNGSASVWSEGFPSLRNEPALTDETHYRGRVSMRQIAKNLAQNLTVHTGQRVVSLYHQDELWHAETADRSVLKAHALLLTPPVPQTLDLLQHSEIDVPSDLLPGLQNVAYHPCIAVLALLDGDSGVPSPGGIWLSGEPVFWIADNRQKGISPDATAVTLHAGPQFSRLYYELDNDTVADRLLHPVSAYLASPPAAVQVHRWKYSRPFHFFPQPCAAWNHPAPIALAGDGFVAASLEGAALSGWAAADHLAQLIAKA